jgi:tRNA dimethylallyltransferase
MKKITPKILVLVGPTASGKSDMAVRLAQKFNGEVISADSRQVYKGLDIGTGKITTEEMSGVPHHLLDVADPHQRFTAMDWKELAEESIADILSRGKLPIICGGTGFYISSLIEGLGFPEVKADTEEQKRLEAKTVEELFEELKKLDPVRASTIDMKNKRRLARAIIIARELGSVPAISKPTEPRYDVAMIGIRPSNIELHQRINTRLIKRLENGMLDEAEKLHAPAPVGIDLPYERMEELGLEYRYMALFLQGKMTLPEMTEALKSKIWQYSRRQMTWWKKDAKIKWFAPQETEKIDNAVQVFLG